MKTPPHISLRVHPNPDRGRIGKLDSEAVSTVTMSNQELNSEETWIMLRIMSVIVTVKE